MDVRLHRNRGSGGKRQAGWRRNLLLAAVAALGCLVAAPGAQALPSISVTPEFPAEVTNQQKGVPASVLITATGDNLTQNGIPVKPLQPGTSNYIAICNSPADVVPGTPPGRCDNSQIGGPYNEGILLTPACASAPIMTPGCAISSADPGVFAISPAATGSGTCAGVTFDVTVFNAALGTVKFTPRAPATRVWIGQAGSSCRISFTFDVLKLPKPGTDGAVTHPIASAGGGYNASEFADASHVKPAPLIAFGRDQVTVRRIPRVCPPGNEFSGIPLPDNITTEAQIKKYCNRPIDEESDELDADMTGSTRCYPRVARVPGATKSPFNVTVRVQNPSGLTPNFLNLVTRVRFYRNGKLIKTMTRPTRGLVGGFRLRVDPRKLAPRLTFRPGGKRPNRVPAASRRYTITAKAFLRPPGTFTDGDPSDTVETLTRTTTGRTIAFRAVRTCRDTPPPPPG